MKVRKGFVSNSSSSSFVVSIADLQNMANYGIKCFKVANVITALDRLRECINDMVEDLPFFMWQELSWFHPNYYDDLVNLHKRDPNCYITEDYDRDQAYNNNFNYQVFETDL
jgi:hypothetical protein